MLLSSFFQLILAFILEYDEVASYQTGISQLSTYGHPCNIFGDAGSNASSVNYDPQEYGVKPLSLMAVVCGAKMISLSPLLLSGSSKLTP